MDKQSKEYKLKLTIKLSLWENKRDSDITPEMIKRYVLHAGHHSKWRSAFQKLMNQWNILKD